MPNRSIVQALGNFLLGSDKFQRSPDSAVGAPQPGDPADPWSNHEYGQRTNGHPAVGHPYANGQTGGFTFPHASCNSGPTWAAARAGTNCSDQQLVDPATAHATSTGSTTNAAAGATDAPRPAQVSPTAHGSSSPATTCPAAPSVPLALPSSSSHPSTTSLVPIAPGATPDPDQVGVGSGRQLEPTLSNASSCSSPAGPPMRAGRPSFSDATASAAGEALRQASMASSKAQFTRDNLVAYMRWVRASRGVMQLAGKGSCRNPHPQLLLRCEHWLEVTDEQHRYGSNLRVYFDYWVAEMEAAELTPPPSPALLSPSPSCQHLIALSQQQQLQGTTGANPPLSTPGSAHAQFRPGESSGLAGGGAMGLHGRVPGSSPLGLTSSKSSTDLTRFGQQQQEQQRRQQQEKSSVATGGVAQVCAAAAAPVSIGGAGAVECGSSPQQAPGSWGPSCEGALQGEVAHQEAEHQQKQQAQQQQQQQQLACHAGPQPQHQRRHSCGVPSEGCGMGAEGQHGAAAGTGRADTPSKGRASSDAALGHGQRHSHAGTGAGSARLSPLGSSFPVFSASRPQCFSPSMRFAQAMGVGSSDSMGSGSQRYQQVQGQQQQHDGAGPAPVHGGVLSPDAGRSPTSGLVCSDLGNAGGPFSVSNGGDSSLGPWTASAIDGRSSAGLQPAPLPPPQQQAGHIAGAGSSFASAAAAAGVLQGVSAQRAAKAMSHRNSVGNGSNFFRWLDHGPGMHVDLAGLGVPRAKLDAERVKYLTAEELLEYELDVEMETGLLRYKRSGKLLHTGHNDGRTSLDLSDTRRPHTPPPPAVPLHTDSSDTPWWAQLPAAACTTGAAAPDPGGTQAWGVGGREGGMGQGSSFRRGVRRTMLDTLHEGQAHERQETGDVLEPGMLGAGQRGVGLDGAARSGVEGLMEEDAEVETEAEGQEVGSMVDGDSEGGSSLPRGGSSSDDVCGSGASPQSTGSTGRVADGGLLDVDGDGAANALDNGRKSCEGTYGLEKPALVRDSSVQAAISGYGGLFSPGAISGGGAGMGLAAAGQGATAEEEAPVVHQAEPAVDSAFCKAAAAALLTEGLRLQGPGEQRQQLEETGHVVQQEQQQQPHSPQPELAAPQPVTPPALQQLRQHSAPPLVVHQEKEKVAKWIYVVDPELRLYVHPKVRGRFHHSSFLCGGAVVAAGGLAARHGQLRLLTADSGHYWPREENFRWLCEHLVSVGADLSNCELRSKHMPVPAATGRELMERMGVPPPPPPGAVLRSSPWRGLHPHMSYPLLPATGSGGLGQGHVGVGVGMEQGQGEGQQRLSMPVVGEQVWVGERDGVQVAVGWGLGAEPRKQISVLEDEEESVAFPGLSWCSIPDLKRIAGGER